MDTPVRDGKTRLQYCKHIFLRHKCYFTSFCRSEPCTINSSPIFPSRPLCQSSSFPHYCCFILLHSRIAMSIHISIQLMRLLLMTSYPHIPGHAVYITCFKLLRVSIFMSIQGLLSDQPSAAFSVHSIFSCYCFAMSIK